MSPIELDYINGGFELLGAVFTWMCVYYLWRDKVIKGVFWGAWVYFTLWGAWNLIYYHGLNQPFSWWGGFILCLGNMAWVILAFIYRKRK